MARLIAAEQELASRCHVGAMTMVEEPESIVPRLLREIREILDSHSDMHRKHQEAFDVLNKKIDAWQETTATGVGLAVHANVRHESLESRLESLERRVEEIESSR